MLIANDSYKIRGKFAAPGLILRVMNPTFDKESGSFYCYLNAYANADDYVAGDIYQERMFEVRIFKNAKNMPGGGPMGHDQTQRLFYAMPEVVYGWGKKPPGESLIAEADWPSDVYAQAYTLLSFLDEFKEFSSDEQVTKAAIEAANAKTVSTKKSSSASS